MKRWYPVLTRIWRFSGVAQTYSNLTKIFEKSFWLLRNLFRSFFKHSQPSFQDRATTVGSALNDIVNVLTAEESWHLKPGILVSIHLFLQCFVLHDTVTLEQILERWGQLPIVSHWIFFLTFFRRSTFCILCSQCRMYGVGKLKLSTQCMKRISKCWLRSRCHTLLWNQECSYLAAILGTD